MPPTLIHPAHMRGNWGIDTVTVWVDVHLEECDSSSPVWTGTYGSARSAGGFETEALKGTTEFMGATVFIKLNGPQSRASFTFNAARVAGLPDPVLLPPDLLASVVGRVTYFISPVVASSVVGIDRSTGEIALESDWQERVRLSRLDLARDFLLSAQELGAMKPGLREVEPSHVRRSDGVKDKSGGWTLYAKTKKSGLDRLYDKFAESRGAVAAGTTRFEAQLQGQRLKSAGLATLGTVTEDRCLAALAKRWNATRWGTPVIVDSALAQVLGQLPRAEARNLMSFLGYAWAGDTALFTDRERRALRRQAKELGLVVGKPLQELAPIRAALDLASGTSLRVPPA